MSLDPLLNSGTSAVGATGDEVLSCRFVVSGASKWIAPYNDRMPVLLESDTIDARLTGKLGRNGLKPAAESALRKWPVFKRLNRTGVGNDDPTIVENTA